MFGRKKSDDYDEYNESINAKYDDDYIRGSEEYRKECSHSHEQTYKDQDLHTDYREYRQECSHDHEQTYEDFNSELAPYEQKSELEAKFARFLMPGEYIIWCGVPEKNATASESGAGCATGCLPVAIVLALILFPILGVVSIGAVVCAVLLMKDGNFKNRSYAITDNSLIILKGSTPHRINLTSIRGVNYKTGPRDIGYVTFNATYSNPRGIITNKNEGIFGIKDPQRVSVTLIQAISDKLNYSGSVRNG